MLCGHAASWSPIAFVLLLVCCCCLVRGRPVWGLLLSVGQLLGDKVPQALQVLVVQFDVVVAGALEEKNIFRILS